MSRTARVVLVVEDQRPLHRRAGLGRRAGSRVEVGQQPVAQLDRVAHEVLDHVAERPGVLVDVAELGVVAAERGQRAVLHPAQEQLGVGVAGEAADVGADEGLSGEPEARRPSACSATGGPSGPGCRPSSWRRSAGCRRTPTRDSTNVRRSGIASSRPAVRAHRHQQRVLVVEALVGRTGRGRSASAPTGCRRWPARSCRSRCRPARTRTWAAFSSPHQARASSVTKSGNAVLPGQTWPM